MRVGERSRKSTKGGDIGRRCWATEQCWRRVSSAMCPVRWRPYCASSTRDLTAGETEAVALLEAFEDAWECEHLVAIRKKNRR